MFLWHKGNVDSERKYEHFSFHRFFWNLLKPINNLECLERIKIMPNSWIFKLRVTRNYYGVRINNFCQKGCEYVDDSNSHLCFNFVIHIILFKLNEANILAHNYWITAWWNSCSKYFLHPTNQTFYKVIFP